MNRRLLLATTAAVFMVVIGASAIDLNTRRTTYLTFNAPIALPGVSLPAGTYIFEVFNAQSTADVVQVLSRDRKHVYLTALTHGIARPANLAGRQVTFAEVPRGAPPRISAWYPLDDSRGHQFVY